MVEIYISFIEGPLQPSLWAYYYDSLPSSDRAVNQKYKRWQDRHTHLIGRLLLQSGLGKLGYSGNVLQNIKKNLFNKPYLNTDISFNISHSGSCVVCAISLNCEIGIDIEQKAMDSNEIEIFKGHFTRAEWDIISSSVDPEDCFYKMWTRKESVVKADGRGLLLPLNEISVIENSVLISDKKWFIQDLNLVDPNYKLALAIDSPNSAIVLSVINFDRTPLSTFGIHSSDFITI